ncbi:MAG: hypothetical protein U0P45_04140 [Acidimicrobiales bacterium]
MAPRRSGSPMPRHRGATLMLAAVVLLASGCGSDRSAAPQATGRSTTTTEAVTATVPPVPAGAKDCGTIDELAGWPTTTTTPPQGYACITDAADAGAPAQMSAIAAGEGTSGRKTQDGYEIPTRQISTWRVTGPGEVQETIDRTEGGGASVTRTCSDLVVTGPRPTGADCA